MEALTDLVDDPALRAVAGLFLRITVLLLVALGLATLLPRRVPATRHALLLAALAGALTLPGLVWIIPSVEMIGGELRFGTGPGFVAPESGAFGILVVTWTSVTLILLVRLLFGMARLNTWARRAGVVTDSPWTRLVSLVAAELGIKKRIDVFADEKVSGPATWGLTRPLLLLPTAADAWPTERRRAVLLHELSHVRRHDCLTQALARIACALLWFHPLAWWCERRMRHEREAACDASVVAAGVRPSTYASDLLAIVRAGRAAPLLPHAAVPLGGRTGLEQRLRRLLAPGFAHAGEPRAGRAAAMAWSVATAAALLTPVPVPSSAPVALQGAVAANPVAVAAIPNPVDAPPTRVQALRIPVHRHTQSDLRDPIHPEPGMEPAPVISEPVETIAPPDPRPVEGTAGLPATRPAPIAPPPTDEEIETPSPTVRWVDLRTPERTLPATRLHPFRKRPAVGTAATYSFAHETRDDARMTRNRWDVALVLRGDALALRCVARGVGSGITDLGFVDLASTPSGLDELSLGEEASLQLGHVYALRVVHAPDSDYWVLLKPFAFLPDRSARITWRIVNARVAPGRVVLPDGTVLPPGRPAGTNELDLSRDESRRKRIVLALGQNDHRGVVLGRRRPDRAPDLLLERVGDALFLVANEKTARLMPAGVVSLRRATRLRVKDTRPVSRLPVRLGLTFVLRLRERQGDRLLRLRIIEVDPAGGVTLLWANLPP